MEKKETNRKKSSRCVAPYTQHAQGYFFAIAIQPSVCCSRYITLCCFLPSAFFLYSRKKLELWESWKLQFSYPYFVGLISTPASKSPCGKFRDECHTWAVKSCVAQCDTGSAARNWMPMNASCKDNIDVHTPNVIVVFFNIKISNSYITMIVVTRGWFSWRMRVFTEKRDF